jgi:predicted ATPase/class 3 adenylate cyclase
MIDGAVPRLPSGTITFLFSDIEGSTRAWDRAPDRMPGVLARHDQIVRAALARHGGYVFATGGDGFAVAFQRADAALAAAVDAQQEQRGEPWPEDLPIRVRIGIHTGEAEERDGDYFGAAVNRTARLMSVANGSQVVLSRTTVDLVGTLPDGTSAVDKGTHRLKDLRRPESIHELVIDGRPGPDLRVARATNDQLPNFATSFVGRRSELDDLAELSSRSRVVTLTGPGGVGKTRLAAAHATASGERTRDGAWFVDLTDAAEGHLHSTVLGALGLPSTGDWGALVGWDAVVVLDNCEHVLDAAADLVDDLLASCPGVRVVATSREALALPGEQILPVGPLLGTDEELGAESANDAVHLFLDRARLANPTFAPSAADLATIGELCRELDGLPLAIELAAARVDRHDLAKLTDSLFAGIEDRRDRRRATRHRSLEATVRWSCDLMDDATRRVFRQLSVFHGGFDADGAVAVIAAAEADARLVHRELSVLIDQSMVQAQRTPLGTRYRMLKTIRVVAAQLLDDAGETAALRDRHLDWIAAWSAANHVNLDRPGWLGPIEELDNQRAGLTYALASRELAQAIDLFADSMWTPLFAGRLDETRRTLDSLSALAESPGPETTIRLDECRMMMAEATGDFETSHQLAERFRNDQPGTSRWYLGAALIVHHFAATAPYEAVAALEEYQACAGAVPMASYLNAEIQLGEARFAEAVESILTSLGVSDVGELGASVAQRCDPGVLIDLTVALRADRRIDEAAICADLLAESTNPAARLGAAALQAMVLGSSGSTDEIVEHLRRAQVVQRRWPLPLFDLDLAVYGAFTAAEVGRPALAAETLAVTRGMPQRFLSSFGIRRALRTRLNAELGDEEWRKAIEAGAGRAPEEAFAVLIDRLATEPVAHGGV